MFGLLFLLLFMYVLYQVEVFAELFNETNRNIVYEFSSLATWMRSFNESQPKDGNRQE